MVLLKNLQTGNKMKLWLLFIVVFLAGLVVFFPSFKLSLYGDDWLVFWRYSYFYPADYTPNVWDHISHFMTRYGSQDVLINILKSIFGYQSTYYYITSFIFRMIAAFSLYPVTFYITKNKLAAFFAMLFLSVATIGLETTEYLAHIPSYISLTFFNLFLYYFLRSREDKEGKKVLFSGLFFYLTFIFAPIRMTGLLPFIFLIEFFWVLQNLNRKILKKFAIRLSTILLFFLFINISGNPFFFPSQQINENGQSSIFLFNLTKDSLFNIFEQLKNGRFDLLFYPIISFGGMFIPATAIPNIATILSKSQLFFLTFFVYCLFITVTLVIRKSISVTKSNSYRVILFLTALWSLISYIVYLYNQTTFPSSKFFILLLVGGYVLILGSYLLYKNYGNQLISQAIFLSLCWSIMAFIVPWFWSPTFLLDTYHRYLIGSAVGISLFLAIIISLAKIVKYQKVVLSLFLIILSIHIWASIGHIQRLLNNHNQQINDKIWSAMPYIQEVGKSAEPLVFYFEGDGTNESILHDTVTFGFPFHMGLLYEITEESKNPISMIEWKDVESAVLDGKSFAPHNKGQILDPISFERVYAFRLQGKDNLINITDIAREKLKGILKNKNEY